LWTVATGQLYGPVLRPGSGASGGVTAVAFSADSTVLAAAYGDGTIRLWNPAASVAIGSPLQAGSGVNDVAFGPGGTLASAGANGAVKVWNTAGLRPGHPVRDWFILVAAVLALALAAAAVTITTREVWPRNFGRT
jgi:WD40 repeat protein